MIDTLISYGLAQWLLANLEAQGGLRIKRNGDDTLFESDGVNVLQRSRVPYGPSLYYATKAVINKFPRD